MSNPEVKVVPHLPVNVSIETYPWISTPPEPLPTVLVTLTGGESFIYGSLIGLNNSIKRISDSVSGPDSNSAQAALFMGLPAVLKGKPHQGISKVDNSNLQGSTLLVASRNLHRGPNLVFAVEPSPTEGEPPTILRAGISPATEYPRLLRIMGIKPIGGRRRRA